MESNEGKLEFLWVKVNELEEFNLLPKPMVELVPRWVKEKKAFFQNADAKF